MKTMKVKNTVAPLHVFTVGKINGKDIEGIHCHRKVGTVITTDSENKIVQQMLKDGRLEEAK